MLFDKCSAPCRYWKIEAVNYTLCSVHGLYVLENRTIAARGSLAIHVFFFFAILSVRVVVVFVFMLVTFFIYHIFILHASYINTTVATKIEKTMEYIILFFCFGEMFASDWWRRRFTKSLRFTIDVSSLTLMVLKLSFFWIFKSITFVLIINHGVDYEEQTDTCLP